ncbi:MAG: family 10 glycosylhydrolase, partial [Chloroflexi bacterium]|nr:family 10 glycosylhydrolase [Chloroflexota bacterium]
MSDAITDRGFRAEPRYVADFDRCTPAEALATDATRGHWQTLSFEADGVSGTMLFAGPETLAPDVTYPLRVEGWHAISVGVHPTAGGESDFSLVQVMLSGDSAFSALTWSTEGHHLRRKELQEIFWKVADLTGQEVVFSQLHRRIDSGDGLASVQSGSARIAYLKLVPLAEDEVQQLVGERTSGRDRRLWAHNDAHGPHYTYRMTTAAEVRREIEPYRDTDFSRMYWESGAGDLMRYFTKIGRTATAHGVEMFPRVGDRLLAESWRSYHEQGIDPFQVALEHTHELGMEFHAAYRLAAWTYPPPMNQEYLDGYFQDHPQWRCLDRDGRELPRMSYAFPEVQDYCLAALREMAEFDLDGICLLFNRRPPYLMYEQPLIEGFTASHGADPRELPEDDPEWSTYRGGVLTGFMRRVRQEMDAVAREQGRRRLEVSACVQGLMAENVLFGCDVATWAREGLIDALIPYSAAPLAMPTDEDTWSAPEQLTPFVEATQAVPRVGRSQDQ